MVNENQIIDELPPSELALVSLRDVVWLCTRCMPNDESKASRPRRSRARLLRRPDGLRELGETGFEDWLAASEGWVTGSSHFPSEV